MGFLCGEIEMVVCGESFWGVWGNVFGYTCRVFVVGVFGGNDCREFAGAFCGGLGGRMFVGG